MTHIVISSFRLVLFRLFVISLGVFSLFCLFAWRYFVLATLNNARRKGEITKRHKPATINIIAVILNVCCKLCTINNHCAKCEHTWRLAIQALDRFQVSKRNSIYEIKSDFKRI